MSEGESPDKVAELVAAVLEWRSAHYAFYCPTVSQQDPESRRNATQRLGQAEAALVTVSLPSEL